MKTTYGKVKGTTISQIHETLSDKNKELIKDFVDIRRGAVTPKRLLMVSNSLVKFADLLELDFDKATKDDITKAWNIINSSKELSIKTRQDDYINIKQGFRRWFGEDDEFPKVVKGMERPTQKSKLKLQKKMPSEKEIYHAIKMCRNARDKFWVAWTGLDSGVRPCENLALNFGSLVIDKNGYGILIKTAKDSGDREDRTIRVINSKPYLLQWMKEYPGDTKDKNNYIFCQLDNPKQPLGAGAITSLFKRLKKRCGFDFPFHAYTLRHALLSRLSVNPKVSIPVLRTMAGHSKSSTILSEYQHHGDPEIENMQREVAGKKVEEINYKLKEKPIECPRCKTSNPYDAEVCDKCKFSWSEERLIDDSDMKKQLKEQAFEIKTMAKTLKELIEIGFDLKDEK